MPSTCLLTSRCSPDQAHVSLIAPQRDLRLPSAFWDDEYVRFSFRIELFDKSQQLCDQIVHGGHSNDPHVDQQVLQHSHRTDVCPLCQLSNGLILDQIGDTRYASIVSRYNGGDEDGERIEIVQWRSHPKYGSKSGDYNYIIFIRRLASSYEPVAVSDTVIASYFVGASLPSMGWMNGSDANSTLVQPSLTTLTLDECVQKRGVGSTMLCLIPKQPEEACYLNVGSPLIETQGGSDYLLALVNYNSACNKTDTPVIFNYLLVAESIIQCIFDFVC